MCIRDSNKTVTVSIDRLKPAYFLPGTAALPTLQPQPQPQPRPQETLSSAVPATEPEDDRSATAPRRPPSALLTAAPPVPDERSTPVLDPEAWPLPTRYGRRPRPPSRLNL